MSRHLKTIVNLFLITWQIMQGCEALVIAVPQHSHLLLSKQVE